MTSLDVVGLRAVVLGRGRVGRALAHALAAAGAAVELAPGGSVPAPADLVLIAVPDDSVASVVDRLTPVVVPGQVVAHTSGRHGLAVLAPVRAAGAHALAFHPAMTFAGGVTDLTGVSIGLTADADALPLAERLCAAFGARPVWIAEASRDLYHAALSHGANHLVTLLTEAQELLAGAGVSDPSALLGPLVRAALEGGLARGAAATTGPVVRGDAGTVAAHLAALEGSPVMDSYLALARATAVRAGTGARLCDVLMETA